MDVNKLTDKYFTKSKKIIEDYGDTIVTYKVFCRRPIILAPFYAENWLREIKNKVDGFKYKFNGSKGDFIPAKSTILTYSGPMSKIVEYETVILQSLTLAPVVAYNVHQMCCSLPHVSFIDMHGRHACGPEMMEQIAYGVSVGSFRARAINGAKGFIGTSNDHTAFNYDQSEGMGTMPHALIGYAYNKILETNSLLGLNIDAKNHATVTAMNMYINSHPKEKNIVVLVDYFGNEIKDSLFCAKEFYKNKKNNGKNLSIRIDTHGGRYMEGLDLDKSIICVAEHLEIDLKDKSPRYLAFECAEKIKVRFPSGYKIRSDELDNILFGEGVSVAAIIKMRKELDANGYKDVSIVASSGFNPNKCLIMGIVKAPLDVVGTGSFMPETYKECYTTADVVEYSMGNSVKLGREWLIEGI